MKRLAHMQSSGGFTLIELVAVIVLLGVISVLVIPVFVDQETGAKAKKAAFVAAQNIEQTRASCLKSAIGNKDQGSVFVACAKLP